jgi:hypothetical protein
MRAWTIAGACPKTGAVVGAILAGAVLAVTPAAAQWYGHHDMTSAQYQQKFTEYLNKGLRVTAVSGYTINNEARFAAIWENKGSGAWGGHHNMTSAQYQQKFTEYLNKGLRVTAVGGYTINNEARFVAIWEQKPGGTWGGHHNMTPEQYQQKFTEYAAKGLRVTAISGYTVNNQPRYVAIWEQKPPGQWVGRHNMTSSQYQQRFTEYAKEGYRITAVNGFTTGTEPRFAAIWEKLPPVAWVGHHGLTSAQYQQKFNEYVKQGYRVTRISGYAVNNQSRFVAIWSK